MSSIFNVNGELDQDVVDVLYEIGNVGVGKAVVPIGNIRHMEIRVDTPNVIAVKDDIFAEIEYDPKQVVVGVATKMSETLDGSILFLLSKEFVKNTVFHMTGDSFGDHELLENEDSISAIQELINYMTAGYAKVIGSYLNIPVYISSASLGMTEAKNIVQEILSHAPQDLKKIACVNTKFTLVDETGEKTNEVGQVLIFPGEKSIQKFVEIMG